MPKKESNLAPKKDDNYINVNHSHDTAVATHSSNIVKGGSSIGFNVDPKGNKISDRRLQVVLAFLFGVSFLACILAVVIFVPSPTTQQFEIFRIIIASAAGGVAAVIPGMLDLNLSRGQNLALRVGGALAVFVIVYFYSPASWVLP